MRRSGIIHPALSAAIGALCHSERFVISDAGLPVPRGVPVIDLAVVHGVPAFLDVLRAVLDDVVIESSIIATEIVERNPAQLTAMDALSAHVTGGATTSLSNTWRMVAHQEFKELVAEARFVVRTGEATPYSNILLVAGVPF